MSSLLSQGGSSLLAFVMIATSSLDFGYFCDGCGGSHMLHGVHHWHQMVFHAYILWGDVVAANKWLVQHLLLVMLRQAKRHYAGSMCGIWNHSPVVIWQLVSIAYCSLCIPDVVYLLRSTIWIALYVQAIGSMILPIIHVYVAGDTMGKPWLPHCYLYLLVGGTTWRICRGIS